MIFASPTLVLPISNIAEPSADDSTPSSAFSCLSSLGRLSRAEEGKRRRAGSGGRRRRQAAAAWRSEEARRAQLLAPDAHYACMCCSGRQSREATMQRRRAPQVASACGIARRRNMPLTCRRGGAPPATRTPSPAPLCTAAPCWLTRLPRWCAQMYPMQPSRTMRDLTRAPQQAWGQVMGGARRQLAAAAAAAPPLAYSPPGSQLGKLAAIYTFPAVRGLAQAPPA